MVTPGRISYMTEWLAGCVDGIDAALGSVSVWWRRFDEEGYL